MLWLQGWDHAPTVVQASRASWERLSGWEVRTLDNITLSAHLPQAEVNSILSGTKEKESISDLIRLSLLHRHGGAWADATTICARPLDRWLPTAAHTGFFAFAKPNKHELSTWFLAASPHNFLVARWRAAAMDYWKNHTQRHSYFWVHTLFDDLLSLDPEFKKAWDSVPKLPSQHFFHFSPNSQTLLKPAPTNLAAMLLNASSPVFKLTYKGMAKAAEGSLFDTLMHYARGDDGVWTCLKDAEEGISAPKKRPHYSIIYNRYDDFFWTFCQCSPFILYRIPKCGSTTIMEWIKKSNENRNHTFVNLYSPLTTRTPSSIYTKGIKDATRKPTFVLGHFYYPSELVRNISALGACTLAWIQVLRVPAERTISFYYYALQGSDRKESDTRRLANMYPNITLEKCINEYFATGNELCFKNDQTRYLSGSISATLNNKDLIVAKYNLEHTYAAFGITEQLDLTREYFAAMFPEYFVFPLQITNQRVAENKGEVSQSLYKQIQAFNDLDEELYKFAVTLFEKRIKAWRSQKTTR